MTLLLITLIAATAWVRHYAPATVTTTMPGIDPTTPTDHDAAIAVLTVMALAVGVVALLATPGC